MNNTHLRFEAKIPNGSKFVAFTRNNTKCLSLKANLTLISNEILLVMDVHATLKGS